MHFCFDWSHSTTWLTATLTAQSHFYWHWNSFLRAHFSSKAFDDHPRPSLAANYCRQSRDFRFPFHKNLLAITSLKVIIRFSLRNQKMTKNQCAAFQIKCFSHSRRRDFLSRLTRATLFRLIKRLTYQLLHNEWTKSTNEFFYSTINRLCFGTANRCPSRWRVRSD